MSRMGILSVVITVGALALPRPAWGQTGVGNAPSAAALLAPAPTQPLLLGSAWVGETRTEKDAERFVELPQARNRRGVTYMIIGGAMFLAGAIIGDDGGTILVLGGIGVGAYGAYIYFR